MKITDYYKHTTLRDTGEFCTDTAGLLREALQASSFPAALPFLRDLNALTHKHAGILNSQRLELSAFAGGFSGTLWIQEADAALLALEPRGKALPLAYPGNGGFGVTLTRFAGSFSKESLERMFSFVNPGENAKALPNLPGTALAARNIAAQKALYAIANYGVETGQDPGRSRMAALYRKNTAPSSPALNVSQGMLSAYARPVPPPARPAFEYLRKFRAQQLTGLCLFSQAERNSSSLRKSFAFLSDNPKEAVTAFYFSRLFAHKLCRTDLSKTRENSFEPPFAARRTRRENIPIEDFIGR
jgi:hypothetical protein